VGTVVGLLTGVGSHVGGEIVVVMAIAPTDLTIKTSIFRDHFVHSFGISGICKQKRIQQLNLIQKTCLS